MNAKVFELHPENPQARALNQIKEIIDGGGIMAYPTDSGYALGCALANGEGLERIRKIRQLDEKHHFTLVCHDFSQLGQLVLVSNSQYRLIKSLTPGPYTFILKGTKEVPRATLNKKKHSVGVRIPDHKVALSLVEALGEAILSCTLILPGEDEPLSDPVDVIAKLGHLLDVIVDAPIGNPQATTVINMEDNEPVVTRHGAGPVDFLE
ncbi:MAG: L-threonylcarbamoyladenylate synthase [Mobiluncus porci]|uniref:Threonylcarbamoyl-AMP synthase n=1 Tax=Mobiluncus porci TaxID=2652278 RepID=A0A7K0K4N3_9ACTO|nr:MULTISPECIES: L-threonylcarbamoyladenylate synthase [Mobiluncus]MCI6584420.1 threonylcarbamoyl-AMP synthase [Mobiluncus sp.]MDD7541840.1 L-threonylcarbamoyladenylate synthase [Mobiluncus porci]MDY5748688.1 L-threonylcarbamoyladenylate synthase [Mobiluncus porci]MST50437.1 threonylcarbamoyl-AMP synthase [Mobiluncus porci]